MNIGSGIMPKDKVVFITGASSGIGADLAIRLAKEGAIPILTARSIDKLEEIAAKINGKYDIYQLDVTSTEAVYQVIEQVIAKYKRIDILINNAGFGVFDYFIDANLTDYEEMMDVNYLGTVRCTKAVLPYMLKENNGQIINIASVAGKLATAKAAGYSATKFAVIGFSNGLRYELADSNVKVATVNPGPIDTPFFNRADPSGTYKKNVDWFMLTTEQVTNEIIKVIKYNKKEKTMPFIANIGVKFYHLFPDFYDRVIAKFINKK